VFAVWRYAIHPVDIRWDELASLRGGPNDAWSLSYPVEQQCFSDVTSSTKTQLCD
jgi:hypothetical protein